MGTHAGGLVMARPRFHILRADGAAVPARRLSNGALAWLVCIVAAAATYALAAWAVR